MMLRGKGKGVQVRTRSRKFHSGDGGDFIHQSQRFDCRGPIHDSVMLGGWCELDMFSCQVDEPVGSSTDIISTWSGMIVKVSTYPSGGFNRSGEGCLDCLKLTFFDLQPFFKMIMLDASGDNDVVFPGS